MSERHGLTKENFWASLPISLSGDPKMAALAEAMAEVLERRREEIGSVSIYPHVDRLEEALLDLLARDFKVDWWDPDYSLPEKRRTLQSSWRVHKLLGTKAAVEAALRAVYPHTRVVEWFEYGARPYHFKLRINVTDDEMDSAKEKRVLARLEYYKNLRSHLDGVAYFMESREALAYAGAVSFGSYQRQGAAASLPEGVGWPKAALSAGVGAAFLGSNLRLHGKTPPVKLDWPRAKAAVHASAGVLHVYERIDGKL